jgi:hypothetical protein
MSGRSPAARVVRVAHAEDGAMASLLLERSDLRE